MGGIQYGDKSSLFAKRVSIKQWEEPQSTSLVEVKEGRDGKETGINRESGSERAAALSRTVRRCVPPELAQPPDGTKSEGLLTLLPA